MCGLIAPQYVNLLMELQDELAEHLSSPGQVPFNKWRASKTQVVQNDVPVRFVDGEFVERFLDCSPEVQDELFGKVKGMIKAVDAQFDSKDVEWFRELLEALRRLH